MKRVILFIFSLVCVVICSCEKADTPEPQFTGTWDVVVKSVENEIGISTQTTVEDNGWIFIFGTDGCGTRIKDKSENSFNYQFDVDSKTITFIEGCSVFTFEVIS